MMGDMDLSFPDPLIQPLSESVLQPPVSNTSDRSDEVPSLAQLAAKPVDVGVHGVCRPLIGLIPHGAQKDSPT